MLPYSAFNVHKFVAKTVGGHSSNAVKLAAHCLNHYLIRGHRCRRLATAGHEFPNQKLHNKFNRLQKIVAEKKERQKRKGNAAAQGKLPSVQMYLFTPDKKFYYETRMLARWIERVEKNCSNLSHYFHVNSVIQQQLLSFRDLDELIISIKSKPEAFENFIKRKIKHERPVFPDEKKRHVRFETDLPHDHFLVRIMTPTGMKIAAEKAQNCLYSHMWPTVKYPHKKRVLDHKKFGYYQARDYYNMPVATICLDFERLQYRYEGNNQQPLQENHAFLVCAWEAYFNRRYPEFNAERPYGTRPRFSISAFN